MTKEVAESDFLQALRFVLLNVSFLLPPFRLREFTGIYVQSLEVLRNSSALYADSFRILKLASYSGMLINSSPKPFG